jgi:hypothetical protein
MSVIGEGHIGWMMSQPAVLSDVGQIYDLGMGSDVTVPVSLSTQLVWMMPAALAGKEIVGHLRALCDATAEAIAKFEAP